MKKFVCGVFTILFVCLISFGVRAQVYSGQCGDYCSEVSWKYDTETETLEISGKGRTVDYPDADAPWHEYGYVSNLIVGEGITYLGESLLYLGNGSFHILDKVVLPSTLDDAGAQVFYSEISELHITDAGTLMRIPDSSVVNSTDREKLTALYVDGVLTRDLVIPDGEKVFCDIPFSLDIDSVTLPASMDSCGNNSRGLFTYIYSLKNIYVEKENETFVSLDGVLYEKDGMKLRAFPKGRTADTYTVHADSTEICSYAFYRCWGVSEIITPDTVVSIGAYAFSDCVSLTYADLPKGLSQMGDGIFSGCENLKRTNIPKAITEVPAFAYEYCSSLESVAVHNGITGIRDYAFANCDSLSGNIIPKSVTFIGYYAFSGCDSIESLELCDLYISQSAFCGCENLKTVEIGGMTKIIPYDAFYRCSALEEVHLGDNIELIEENAFSYCSALRKIYFSKKCNAVVKSGAFDGVYAVIFGYEGSRAREIAKENEMLFCCVDNDTAETFLLAKGTLSGFDWSIDSDGLLTVSGEGDFPEYSADENPNEAPWFKYRMLIKTAILSEGITGIAEYQFWGCEVMESIVLPKGIKYIGKHAFRECDSLCTVYFGGTKKEYEAIDIKSMKNSAVINADIWCKGEKGDIDGDGEIGYEDITKMLSVISGKTNLPVIYGDFSGDGKVGTEDLNILLELIREKNGDVTA